MVNISDCFYCIINLLCSVMKLAVMICKSNRFLEILLIMQCNLQIGKIGKLDGIYTYVRNYLFLQDFGAEMAAGVYSLSGAYSEFYSTCSCSAVRSSGNVSCIMVWFEVAIMN